MSNDIRDIINGEYDPMFDFSKHYNPSKEDKEAAETLMLKYEKLSKKNT